MKIRQSVFRIFLSILLLGCVSEEMKAQLSSESIRNEKILSSFKRITTPTELNSAKKFIETKLDFSKIEHTPYWKPYIQYWVSFYLNFADSQETFSEEFVPVAKEVLAHIKENNPSTAQHLSNDLIEFFDQYALDIAAASIAAYINYEIDVPGDQYSEIASRILTSARLSKGGKAPVIEGIGNESKLRNVIIIFYDQDCEICTSQIKVLIDKYEFIQKKGYDVISIAADTNPQLYEKYAQKFPWKDKTCDFKGLEGNNFKNYGVVSTPIFYLTNEDGIIIGKYSGLDQIDIFNNKHP